MFRRRGFGLRHVIFSVIAFVLVYNIALAFKSEPQAADSADAATVAQMAFMAPQPNVIAPHEEQQPSVEADADDADMPAKTPVAAAEPEKETIGKHISSIQTNIANMLEASNRLLVSKKRVVVGRGDTLMDLLVKRAAVRREDAYQVVQALSKVYNPRDINPGREITVFFHKDPSIADPKFSGIRIEKDIINSVTVNRGEDGGFKVNREEKDVHRVLKGFKGRIDSSLYVDAKAAGVPDSIIFDLIKMYSWNVDFQREIRDGDKFEVMHEEYKTADGRVVPGRGNIVYAKLSLGDTTCPSTALKTRAALLTITTTAAVLPKSLS